MIDDQETLASGGSGDSLCLEDQIERSQTLSALASYFSSWMPYDASLYFVTPSPETQLHRPQE